MPMLYIIYQMYKTQWGIWGNEMMWSFIGKRLPKQIDDEVCTGSCVLGIIVKEKSSIQEEISTIDSRKKKVE
ncbi:MAG: hypothetical protein AAFQ83_16905 [Bacteroidota bacterium]